MSTPNVPSRTGEPAIHGIDVEFHGERAHVWFDRPPVNAFSVQMLVRLGDVLDELGARRCPVLFVGANKLFSAGFDIKQFDVDGVDANALAGDVLRKIRSHPAPLVAAVEGFAVGLGLLIATSADLLVISRTAALRMPEIKVGIDVDTAPLERFLPSPWIRRMCLTGTGHTADEMQLAARVSVCEPGTSLAGASELLAQLDSVDRTNLARAALRLRRLGDRAADD